jgi:tRNA pseudouridine-54 N-methylase
VLDPDGEDIRKADIKENPVFILGDHRGLPLKELKRLKKSCELVSIGPETYFATQTIAVVHNELDRREADGRLDLEDNSKGQNENDE